MRILPTTLRSQEIKDNSKDHHRQCRFIGEKNQNTFYVFGYLFVCRFKRNQFWEADLNMLTNSARQIL